MADLRRPHSEEARRAVSKGRRAYLGLGGNLGDRAALLEAAIVSLAATPGLTVVARSAFYETPPWGETNQPAFLNAAVAVDTRLSPHELLDACLAVERALGRIRDRRWGPRLIDIDVLHIAGVQLADDRLTLPHPHLTARAFVLVPLAEIAPGLAIDGEPIAAALARLDTGDIRRVAQLPDPP